MQRLVFFLLIMLANSIYGAGQVPGGAEKPLSGVTREIKVPDDFKPFMDKEGCENCKIVAGGGTQTLYCECKDEKNQLKKSQLKLNGCESKHKTKNMEDLKDKIHNKNGQLVCGD